jgi:5-formyltetrahydrofolate cyclo-ligase
VTEDPALAAEKANLRRVLRAKRAEAAAAGPDGAVRLLEHFPLDLARLTPVGGYWPVGSEIDPRVLMAALSRAGAVVALPHVVSRQGPTRFLLWETGATLRPDAFGVPSPPADAAEVVPKLVLVPLLGFDRQGRRLGQGGGHYDRILAGLRPSGLIAIGLAYDDQEWPDLPHEPHDQPLDWVLTPSRAVRCA